MSDGGAVNRRRGYVIGDGLSGGFWRRVVAFWIDHALVGLALSLIGVAAFTMTDGKVRYANAGPGLTHCTPIDETASRNTDRLKVVPSASPLPGLRRHRPPDRIEVADCQGLVPSHRLVRVAFIWGTYRETVERPLNPSGRVMARTFDLGALYLPLLLVWLAVSEAVWGGGPGKRLMGLRVLGPDGVRPARLRATLARNAFLYGPPAILALGSVIHSIPGLSLSGSSVAGIGILVVATSLLWSLVLMVCVLVQRPDPFWDRWPGVSVRRRVWIEDR
ncbi:RDD family protein [Brevundimonas sp. LM2]|uniref:RDD family protein n=1 Tax=Brevundimonas sp. LM2 TaxID=1938605 RepID=UPI0015C5382B|nr:RDD family protein [Brevundimonas sp. LM2]